MEDMLINIFALSAAVSIMILAGLYIIGVIVIIPVGVIVTINRKNGRYKVVAPAPQTPKKYMTNYTTARQSIKPPQAVLDCKQETYKINPYYRKIGNYNVRQKIIEITDRFEAITNILYVMPDKEIHILSFVKETIISCENILSLAVNSSLTAMSNTNQSYAQSKSEESIIKALNLVIEKINKEIQSIKDNNIDALNEEIEALEKSLRME